MWCALKETEEEEPGSDSTGIHLLPNCNEDPAMSRPHALLSDIHDGENSMNKWTSAAGRDFQPGTVEQT